MTALSGPPGGAVDAAAEALGCFEVGGWKKEHKERNTE
jgi:hypothetical protein